MILKAKTAYGDDANPLSNRRVFRFMHFYMSADTFDFPRRQEYPRPPLEPSERKSVTTAAAFMCRDGMVICTDTELTLGDALKYSQGKIRFLVADGSAVVMTGAGHWDYMEMAFEKIAERFRSYVSKADITVP